ncbi:AAA family ATPase [Streptomyces sp. NPDC050516]|uniref:AAA family ATPase n=1 Tax=Streptomyces sp. NPDC050516 TaxID=3365621 RepID=UPI0037AD3E6B
MVTVTGVGKVGKTRIALRAAAAAAEQERYCDGVRLVELSALNDPGLLDHAVVEALGLTDHTARPPRRLLLDHLAERQPLLVIDGFEQLVDSRAELLRELLRACPGLRVLAAGRLPLRIDGEQVFTLAPMCDEDALRLFTERAAGGRAGERPAEGHEAAAAELCRRLDGIPLALELASGRLGTLSVEQLLHRLDDCFRLLTGGGRGALPRHCGRLAEGRHWLAQVLDAESGHDSSRLKALWVLGHVAVLQGDAVAAIAALQECREEAELCGDPVAAAYAVHRTGCLALVTDDMPRAEELLREALAGYDEVGELNSNVLMGQVEMAMAVGYRGRLEEAVSVCEQVVEICEDHGERWARAYALYVLAYAAWYGGDPERTQGLLRETLAVNHAFHDLVGTVLTLEMLALVEVGVGDPAEAAVLQGAAERIWPSVGLPLFGSAYFYAAHVLCEERTRERLGDAAYEEHRRLGAPPRHERRGGPGTGSSDPRRAGVGARM